MIVVQQVASNLCRIDFLCVHVDISIRVESYLRYFEINSLEIKNSLDNVEHLSLWITRTETTSETRLINMQCMYTKIDMRNWYVDMLINENLFTTSSLPREMNFLSSSLNWLYNLANRHPSGRVSYSVPAAHTNVRRWTQSDTTPRHQRTVNGQRNQHTVKLCSRPVCNLTG